MVLDAKAPAVAQSWSAGASLAVTASSWAPALADGSWRLVVEKARVIENDALPRVVERWRADANTVETTIKTFNVTIAPNPGLGIALEEIVLGSGEQELPRVLVEGLVEGGAAATHAEAARAAADGAAAGAGPLAGDTLTEVRGSGMAFDVECAPYDGVVGAIGEALAGRAGDAHAGAGGAPRPRDGHVGRRGDGRRSSSRATRAKICGSGCCGAGSR